MAGLEPLIGGLLDLLAEAVGWSFVWKLVTDEFYTVVYSCITSHLVPYNPI